MPLFIEERFSVFFIFFFLSSFTSAQVKSVIAQMQYWHPVAWPVNDRCVSQLWSGVLRVNATQRHSTIGRTWQHKQKMQPLVIFLRPKIIISESACPFNEVHVSFTIELNIKLQKVIFVGSNMGFPLCIFIQRQCHYFPHNPNI